MFWRWEGYCPCGRWPDVSSTSHFPPAAALLSLHPHGRPGRLCWEGGWVGEGSLELLTQAAAPPERASPARLNWVQEAPGWETHCLTWRFCSAPKCVPSASCSEVKLLSFPLSCQTHSHFFLRKKQGPRQFYSLKTSFPPKSVFVIFFFPRTEK